VSSTARRRVKLKIPKEFYGMSLPPNDHEEWSELQDRIDREYNVDENIDQLWREHHRARIRFWITLALSSLIIIGLGIFALIVLGVIK